MSGTKHVFTSSGVMLFWCVFVFTSTVCANPASFDVLMGKWIRPNGGYVIQINKVGTEGHLDAEYFNPKSIHVEKAFASHHSGKLEIFIELQDINYPGSTYRLVYDRKNDILAGVYFQAVDHVTYQIYFKRIQQD